MFTRRTKKVSQRTFSFNLFSPHFLSSEPHQNKLLITLTSHTRTSRHQPVDSLSARDNGVNNINMARLFPIFICINKLQAGKSSFAVINGCSLCFQRQTTAGRAPRQTNRRQPNFRGMKKWQTSYIKVKNKVSPSNCQPSSGSMARSQSDQIMSLFSAAE